MPHYAFGRKVTTSSTKSAPKAPPVLKTGPQQALIVLKGKNKSKKFGRMGIVHPNGKVEYLANSKPIIVFEAGGPWDVEQMGPNPGYNTGWNEFFGKPKFVSKPNRK